MEKFKISDEEFNKLLATKKRMNWSDFYADLEANGGKLLTTSLPYSLRSSLKQRYFKTHDVHWAKVEGGHLVWLTPLEPKPR